MNFVSVSTIFSVRM